MPGQTEIGNLEDSLVADEQVGSLHISVEDVVVVEVSKTLEQLEHVTLDLGFLEVDGRVIEKTGEIVVHVWRGHIDNGLFALVGYKTVSRGKAMRSAGTYSVLWGVRWPCLRA